MIFQTWVCFYYILWFGPAIAVSICIYPDGGLMFCYAAAKKKQELAEQVKDLSKNIDVRCYLIFLIWYKISWYLRWLAANCVCYILCSLLRTSSRVGSGFFRWQRMCVCMLLFLFPLYSHHFISVFYCFVCWETKYTLDV